MVVENFNSRAIVINSPVIILTDWMIQYIHFWYTFSSMLAIIFLSEFVSTIIKIARAFWASSKILMSGYFSKSFNAIVMIREMWFSVSNVPLLSTHTQLSTCCPEFDSAHCSCTSATTAPKPKDTTIKACAFWTLDFLVGFHVFSLGNFMEALLTQARKNKMKINYNNKW